MKIPMAPHRTVPCVSPNRPGAEFGKEPYVCSGESYRRCCCLIPLGRSHRDEGGERSVAVAVTAGSLAHGQAVDGSVPIERLTAVPAVVGVPAVGFWLRTRPMLLQVVSTA